MLITVTSHKGGVGKTATAVHLAAFLAREYGGEEVVLVDTDPNESALDQARRGVEVRGETGLPFRVVGPEEETWEEHIVFDSQGRLAGEDLEAALEGSDLLVVPTMPDFPELRALTRFVADVEDATEDILEQARRERRESDPPAPYRVLITMVPWYERLYSPGRAELEDAGIPLFKAQVESRKAFKHAAALGVPVYGVKGRAARSGWEDYQRVGREVVEQFAGLVR